MPHLQNGISQTKLAADFGCSRRTIFNTIERFQQQQTIKSRPRTGRPKIFSDRTRNFIFLQARWHPFYTYKQLNSMVPGYPSRHVRLLVTFEGN
jgi:transposase